MAADDLVRDLDPSHAVYFEPGIAHATGVNLVRSAVVPLGTAYALGINGDGSVDSIVVGDEARFRDRRTELVRRRARLEARLVVRAGLARVTPRPLAKRLEQYAQLEGILAGLTLEQAEDSRRAAEHHAREVRVAQLAKLDPWHDPTAPPMPAPW